MIKTVNNIQILLLGLCLCIVQIGKAQNIGINSAGVLPDPSAALDIDANDKGVLVPRIALTGTDDLTTIASPAISLLIYNTATISDVEPGFYYFDGSSWKRIGSDGISHDWYKVGTGSSPEAITDTIYTKGLVGIGTASPTETLEVNGYVKIKNGYEGENKVLVSDALGKANWETIPGSWYAYLSGGSSPATVGGQVAIDFTEASVIGHGGTSSFVNDNITVPVSGTYKLSISGWATGFTNPYLVKWDAKVNGGNIWAPQYSGATSQWGIDATVFTIVTLNAGDVLSLDRVISTPGGAQDGITENVVFTVELLQ